MSISSSLLAKLIAAQSDSDRRWIVTESLLESLPDDLATAFWDVAIPHWFDAEILAALCPELADRAEDIYRQLQEISCVEVFAERGHNVHELTRNQLLNRLWQTKPDSFRELSARAASYFRNRDKPETQIEWSYHLLIANPTSAYQMLCSFWIKWGNRNAGIELESLLESLIVNLQQQIDANRSTFVVSNFIDYLRDESSAFNVSDELSQLEAIKRNLIQINTSLSTFGRSGIGGLPRTKLLQELKRSPSDTSLSTFGRPSMGGLPRKEASGMKVKLKRYSNKSSRNSPNRSKPLSRLLIIAITFILFGVFGYRENYFNNNNFVLYNINFTISTNTY